MPLLPTKMADPVRGKNKQSSVLQVHEQDGYF